MKIDEAVSKLIERLRAVKWEVTDDGDRMPDDPTYRCVFVDMRPDDFRALLREAADALEAAREDAERLDWFDTNWFTAYRNCDPIGLSKHCVLVDESQRTRRRCVAETFRAAIDQARGKEGP